MAEIADGKIKERVKECYYCKRVGANNLLRVTGCVDSKIVMNASSRIALHIKPHNVSRSFIIVKLPSVSRKLPDKHTRRYLCVGNKFPQFSRIEIIGWSHYICTRTRQASARFLTRSKRRVKISMHRIARSSIQSSYLSVLYDCFEINMEEETIVLRGK